MFNMIQYTGYTAIDKGVSGSSIKVSRISYLSELLSSVFARQGTNDEAIDEGSFGELCDAILSHQGESSGSRLSHSLLQKFDNANTDEQLEFFRLLATRFDINAEHAVRAAQRYADDHSAASLAILMESVEPRRQELFRRLNRLPGATNELVKMRALLLKVCKDDAELQRIDLDFQHLFSSWFNQGFLVLRKIDWHTPANILEKIIAYEAVHAISSWTALRKRLEPCDRRCFAFFHPAMLDEPLIFVEVALTVTSPVSIGEILKGERHIVSESEARTAVFYSISNCQKGLAGVSLGNFLIKQVANELSRSVPTLETFRTLSPVPGFMRWVNAQLKIIEDNSASVEVDNQQQISEVPVQWLKLARQVAASTAAASTAAASTAAASSRLESPDAASDTAASTAAAFTAAASTAAGFAAAASTAAASNAAVSRAYECSDEDNLQLQKLVAHYLLNTRRADMQATDPVARFHLGNGASLDAVLPGADVYEKGLSQSAGVMVSYLYDLDKVAANHEGYADERKIMSSEAVRNLLEPEKRKRKLA